MKKSKQITASLWLGIGLLTMLSLEAAAQEMRVMSYNIRYKNSIDSINGWEHRKANVAALIKYHQADIVGVQEAQASQMADMEKMLSEYGWSGEPRIEGPGAETAAVFYKKDRFNLLDSGTFWFSETPDVKHSKSWDAMYPRTVSWVKLKDKKTKKEFFFFNTHLDHRGEIARQQSAEVLNARVKAIAGSRPVIVTGDFNSTPTSIAYQKLMEGGILKDALDLSETPHYGPVNTSSGFTVKTTPIRARIDYVFVTPAIRVLQHATLTDQQEGRYYSDHLPVIAVLQLAK